MYKDCCKPYIKGKKNAPTPEALMRSRYTAYVVHAIDYIIDTCHEDTKKTMNRKGIEKWSEEATWLGFKIIAVEGGGDGAHRGTVEFEACFEQKMLSKVHHEVATFEKIGDRWLYVDGKITPKTIVRVGEKIGRNDPCPCRSGRKYKHCCGQ
jgi:SEC-C motif-containing protein